MSNILVTGIPRSGTTLVSALIDGLPDAVCLNEPDWQAGNFTPNPTNYAKWLVGDFVKVRRRLLLGESVPERRAADGSAVTNYYKLDPESNAVKTNYTTVRFTRPGLSENFSLAIKHNGPYMGALPAIAELAWFRIVAVVRNPIDVIHSWRSLDLPISRGEMPNATAYWPALAELTARPMDLLERQVRIYDLICRRLVDLRPYIHLLTYEALRADPQALTQATAIAGEPNRALIDKPSREVPVEERDKIHAALRYFGEYYRAFYPDM
ncbi:MAG: sulfotransferase [Rickettsiales bacterium]|nr:sulfotransferase [Rickettsiales bacterium]